MVTQKIPIIKTLQRCQDVSVVEALCSRLVDFGEQIKSWVGKQMDRLSAAVRGVEGVRVTEAPPEPVVSSTPKLSVVWRDYVAWKSWTEKRAKENQRTFDNLLHFLGDVSVDQITKADLKFALASISGLPVRNKKAYKGLTLAQLTKLEIPEEDILSGKSVKEHLKLAQSLFNAYLVREVDVLTTSPTEGLRWECDDNRYASLTDAQVREALTRSKSKPEWFQWFLKIAVYSGARRSEIAALRPCDFKLCPDTGRHYFVVQEGKTKAARRIVPVHPKLLEAGLILWIGEGNDLIFQTAATTPNRVTANFGSLLDQRANDIGERVVFHSVRHTFITKARAAGLSTPLIQQVVGHEKSGAGVTDRYTHSFQMKDVLPVVDRIEY